MRRRQLIGWIVVGGLAASACSGASGAPRLDSAQLPEDRPIHLHGSFAIDYGNHGAGCEPEPRAAQVESRVVEIRDDAGELVASAVTGPSADLRSGVLLCSVKTRFETHLPRRHSFSFRVEGVPGSGEPISFEDLKRLGFECPLTIIDSFDRELPHLSCIPPRYEIRMPETVDDLR